MSESVEKAVQDVTAWAHFYAPEPLKSKIETVLAHLVEVEKWRKDWREVAEGLTVRLAEAEKRTDRYKDALEYIRDYNNSVEAEDCPHLRGVAGMALDLLAGSDWSIA